MKGKKVIIGVLVVAVIGAVVHWKMGQTKEVGPVQPTVTTGAIEKKAIEDSITLKAPLEGTESVEIVSRLHYEVLNMNVTEGDKVTKGQLLAVLDSTDLQKEIRDAEDELELKRIQNEEKQRDDQRAYEKAVSEYAEVKRQYDTMKKLVDSGIETGENLKLEEKKLEDAQRALDDFTVVDGIVQLDQSYLKAIEIAENAIARKRSDLSDCQIKSTINGTITRVNIKVGRFADDTDDDKPMFVIENIDNLQMKVSVSEYDIAKISAGQQVEITADVLGNDSLQGVVSRISPTGELKDGNTTERVIPITIDVQEQDSRLIAGINAKAKITTKKDENALVIPNIALGNDPEGNPAVYRLTAASIVEVIPVEIGIENDIEVQVISDRLAEGDNVILDPGPELTDGLDLSAPAGDSAEGTDGDVPADVVTE